MLDVEYSSDVYFRGFPEQLLFSRQVLIVNQDHSDSDYKKQLLVTAAPIDMRIFGVHGNVLATGAVFRLVWLLIRACAFHARDLALGFPFFKCDRRESGREGVVFERSHLPGRLMQMEQVMQCTLSAHWSTDVRVQSGQLQGQTVSRPKTAGF